MAWKAGTNTRAATRTTNHQPWPLLRNRYPSGVGVGAAGPSARSRPGTPWRTGRCCCSTRPPQPAARSVLVPTAQQTYYSAPAPCTHTTYSDGRGSFEEARTAERCGLDFLITADHGWAPLRRAKKATMATAWRWRGWRSPATRATCSASTCQRFDPARGEAARVLAAIRPPAGSASSHWCVTPLCLAAPANQRFHRHRDRQHGHDGMRRINPPNLLRALIRYRLGGTRHAFALLARRPTPELRAWDRLTQERRVGIGRRTRTPA